MRGVEVASFNEWLNGRMKAKLITGPELARALQVSRYIVMRWRSGTLLPDDGYSRKLAQYFHTPPERILRMVGGILKSKPPGDGG